MRAAAAKAQMERKRLEVAQNAPPAAHIGDAGLVGELNDGARQVHAETTKLQSEKAARSEWKDGDYWFAVCFQSKAQKLEVLQALGLPVHADKYISGDAFIDALQLQVTRIGRPPYRMRKSERWAALAEPLPSGAG